MSTIHFVGGEKGGCGSDFSGIADIPVLIPEGRDSPAVEQIFLPALHNGTMAKIDKFNLSFWAAANFKDANLPGLSLMERQRTRVWLKKSYGAISSVIDVN